MINYVKIVGEYSVQVIAQSANIIQILKDMGGFPNNESDLWNITYGSEKQLANILQKLRDSEIAFAGGNSGWPPAAVAELLREKGLLHGEITEVHWSGPGKEVIQKL